MPITANPDTYEYELTSECDFIIMGCDGVWETKTNEEMVAWVYNKLGSKPEEADLKKIISDLLNEQLSPNARESCKFLISVSKQWFLYRGRWLRQHDLHPDRVQEGQALIGVEVRVMARMAFVYNKLQRLQYVWQSDGEHLTQS